VRRSCSGAATLGNTLERQGGQNSTAHDCKESLIEHVLASWPAVLPLDWVQRVLSSLPRN
jgi:hypothetical protein